MVMCADKYRLPLDPLERQVMHVDDFGKILRYGLKARFEVRHA